MDHEVERRLEPMVRSAHEARDTHRAALNARDTLIAELRGAQDELRRGNEELRRRLAELEAGNRDLRTELAQRRAAESPGRHRAQAAPRPEITSDLFRCLDCSSLWLLSTWPDQIRTVCRPVGSGCPTCAGQPLRRLREVKATAAASGTAGEVARPAGGCAGLDAIADGLDRQPKAVGDGIAWCATGIVGAPEFPATVLSDIVTSADVEPVDSKAIARAVRLVVDNLAEPGSGMHRP